MEILNIASLNCLSIIKQNPEKDFWNTFNLGVGFCLIIDKKFKDAILSICKDYEIDSWEIGKIVRKNDSTISKFLPEILT